MLGAPMDVFVVRKLGLPDHPELALGAIASGGVRVMNEDVLAWYRPPGADARDHRAGWTDPADRRGLAPPESQRCLTSARSAGEARRVGRRRRHSAVAHPGRAGSATGSV